MKAKSPVKEVVLAFACREDWSKMQPCAEGSFCRTCQKTVFDFTQKSLEEVQEVHRIHGSICGRFYRSQVQLQSPVPVKTSFWRKAVAGVLVTLGFTTFGNFVKAQGNVPSKQDSTLKTQDSEAVFGQIMETNPVFKKGGNEGLSAFLKQNIRNPTYFEGTVFVSFLVDTTGKPKDVQIIHSESLEVSQEAIRLIELLEFEPAIRLDTGEKIKRSLTISIPFGK